MYNQKTVKNMSKATKEQVAEWKKEHGDVFEIEVDGKVCYLKKPTRRVLSAAAVAGQRDPMKYNEVILTNCWLWGDEVIKTDDALFLGVSAKLGDLVEVVEASIKKL